MRRKVCWGMACRARLILSTTCRNCGLFGSTNQGSVSVSSEVKFTVGAEFESTATPPSTADHAARLVWFTPSKPRAALSLTAVVNNSRYHQSLVG